MIINIRGTNGSGKSTTVDNLLKLGQARPIYGLLGPKFPEAYLLEVGGSKVFVLGPYGMCTGGCDRIHDYSSIISLIRKYEPRGVVVFEGAMISSTWGALGAVLEEYGNNATILFLDTSLECCLENLSSRGKSGNRLHTVKLKFDTILRIYKKLKEAGKLDVRMVSVDDALHTMLKVIRGEQ